MVVNIRPAKISASIMEEIHASVCEKFHVRRIDSCESVTLFLQIPNRDLSEFLGWKLYEVSMAFPFHLKFGSHVGEQRTGIVRLRADDGLEGRIVKPGKRIPQQSKLRQ